jgi:hypothetical protein
MLEYYRPPPSTDEGEGACYLLSAVLAPLVDVDEYTCEEMDLLPAELQYMERAREADQSVRGMLVSLPY